LDIYIEKDYWVCYALKLIFESPVKDEVIFKGGTALSKCYTYIERFSEDIDLVVIRKEEETGSQLKAKLIKITKEITGPFVEVEMKEITNKMGMIRKIAYNYPKIFKGNYGQVRDAIIIEATWLDGTRTFYQNCPFYRASERVKIQRHRIAHLLTNINLFNIKNDGY
jgi:hypothetical protein